MLPTYGTTILRGGPVTETFNCYNYKHISHCTFLAMVAFECSLKPLILEGDLYFKIFIRPDPLRLKMVKFWECSEQSTHSN